MHLLLQSLGPFVQIDQQSKIFYIFVVELRLANVYYCHPLDGEGAEVHKLVSYNQTIGVNYKLQFKGMFTSRVFDF